MAISSNMGWGGSSRQLAQVVEVRVHAQGEARHRGQRHGQDAQHTRRHLRTLPRHHTQRTRIIMNAPPQRRTATRMRPTADLNAD
jgi:hypothetical protein